jgi:hypothetical protein
MPRSNDLRNLHITLFDLTSHSSWCILYKRDMFSLGESPPRFRSGSRRIFRNSARFHRLLFWEQLPISRCLLRCGQFTTTCSMLCIRSDVGLRCDRASREMLRPSIAPVVGTILPRRKCTCHHLLPLLTRAKWCRPPFLGRGPVAREGPRLHFRRGTCCERRSAVGGGNGPRHQRARSRPPPSVQ